MTQNHKYNILMFNMSDYKDWQEKGIVNRNYFILHELVKRNEVNRIVAVDFLPYNKKRALKSFFKNQSGIIKKRVVKRGLTWTLFQINEKLYNLNLINSGFNLHRDSFNRKLLKTLSYIQFYDFINWSYIPTDINYYNMHSRLDIFDAVDNWAEHPNYKGMKNKILSNYEYIDRNADIIFTVSKEMKKVFKTNKNVHWVPNGIDIGHFNKKEADKGLKDINKIKPPIIGYVGIIQNRLDVKLIEYLVEKNPKKSFVFIGSIWPDINISKLKKFKNVHFLGYKKYNQMPMYISKFSIAIIPHKINKFTESMNPMKLYEYMAAGKPIVSTKIAGVGEFKDFVDVAENKKEFHDKINKAICEINPQIEEKRKVMLSKHTWEVRVDKMLRIIKKNKKKDNGTNNNHS